jgi:hypothetical protein
MIAFCLWAEGFSEPKKLQEMREYPPGRFEIVGGEYKIDRCKIPDYFTDDFWHNLTIWDRCNSMGYHTRMGWAAHDSVLLAMLQAFDIAKAKDRKAKG